jgi:galactose mutarotase-like enzyme
VHCVTLRAASVVQEITSGAGDEVYPGTLVARCEYAMSAMALCLTMTAQVTAPSPVNFLHHSDFNLEGSTRIAQHRLRIGAAPVLLQDGRPCPAESGLCLEATRFNDAMNFAQFGDVITRPERPYVQRTEFHFRTLVDEA